MAVFKCKMCGGALTVADDDLIVECEFCGTKQTLPKLSDEKRTNLYDRANHFRRNNDYDKALSIYEQILNEDKTDAEAYWSIVLCKYGIEYVEDPSSHKRIPTINRTQFTSIFADEDYKCAIENASGIQRDLYEREAQEIDKIQRKILAISDKENPFDVFICYKETDNAGRRTVDSVLAQELFFALKDEGLNVFFSRITLEDKLGSAYEPYIFAALNSAKVMVVLGTKAEHFNAVWVKNEWSRYLALIKKGEKKTLIPAYKDMDPYDLPEEFSHLQAQDMSKLGFMLDLIHAIKKIVGEGRTKPIAETKEVTTKFTQNILPLLKRAALFLEDGDFSLADKYCEKVLDSNPECAEAYLLKTLVDFKLESAEQLGWCPIAIDENTNFKKALRFASPEYLAILQGYQKANEETIEANNERKRKEAIYRAAVARVNVSATISDAKKSIAELQSIGDYRDSLEKIEKIKGAVYEVAVNRVKGSPTISDCIKSLEDLHCLDDFKNSLEKIESIKDAIYRVAVARVGGEPTIKDCKKSLEELQVIGDYKDALCEKTRIESKLADLEREEKERERIAAEQRKLEEERRKELEKIRRARREKAMKISALVLAALLVISISVVLILDAVHRADLKKRQGLQLSLEEGYYVVTGIEKERESLAIPSNYKGKPVKKIASGALNSGRLRYVTVPESIEVIENAAFYGCSNLRNIALPFVGGGNSLPKEYKGIFGYIFGSKQYFGSSFVSNGYDESGWWIPTSLTVVAITKGDIPAWAFANCRQIKEIYLPETAKSIGEHAFDGCASLVAIEIPKEIKKIGDEAFYACNNLRNIKFDAEQCDDLRIDSNVFIYLGYWFDETNVKIGKDVKKIPANLFFNCENLTSVEFEEGSICEEIGDGAFYGCTHLNQISMPKSITKIGVSSFDGCSSIPYVVSNGLKYFGDYEYLVDVVNPKALTNAVISEKCRIILDKVFYDCTVLNSVVIPKSMVSIGNTAFQNCTALTALYYKGNEADWNAIEIGQGANKPLLDATVYYYTNTEPEVDDNEPKYVENYWRYISGEPTVWTYTPTLNTLSFDGNGATSGVTFSMQIYAFSSRNLIKNGYQKEGQSFLGWSTTKDGSVEYQDGAEFTMKKDNCTLYAVWGTPLYFDGNGATSGTVKKYGFASGQTRKLPLNTFTKKGYTFAGWSSVPNGVVEYLDGADYTMGTNSSYRLYAVWAPNLNTLSFDGNGATGGSTSAMQIHSDETKPLNANGFVKTGYTFAGWSLTSNGAVKYANSANYTMGTNSSYTLYAVWTPNLNTLSFDGNGATGGSTSAMQIHSDETKSLNANGFVKTGYTFAGWSLTSNGAVEYLNGADYTMGTNSSYTLYAVWTPNLNTLSFDGNGATGGSTAAMNIQFGASAQLNKNGFVRIGYEFQGWATEPNGEVVYLDGALYQMGENSSTLYAIWQVGTAGLEYSVFGGECEVTGYSGTDLQVLIPERHNGYPIVGVAMGAFSNSSITSIEFSSGLRYIESGAVVASSLVDVVLPDTLLYIGVGNFTGSQLNYNVLGGLKYLGSKNNPYLYLTGVVDNSLKSADIAETCKIIGAGAFPNCSSLTTLTIPDGIEFVNYNVFISCTSLTYTVKNGLRYLGNEKNPYVYLGQTLDTTITSAVIEDGCKIIGGRAFRYCASLNSVQIPNGIRSITDNAFFGASALQTLKLPDGLKVIDRWAFERSGIKSIEIPDSVVFMGQNALASCTGLESIVIGKGIKRIRKNTFTNVVALRSVYYSGSAAEWAENNIDTGNDALLNATKYFYSETEPKLNGSGTAYDGNYWHYVDGVPTVWVYTKQN